MRILIGNTQQKKRGQNMNKLKNYSKDICFFLFLLLIIWVAASSYDFGWSGGNMKEWNLIKILVDIFIKPKLI
jgi:hypothetical protein